MTSRRRILDFVQAHPGATGGEVSRALRQTAANARHHLRNMEREGLVRSVRRPSRGRGRPEKAYSLRVIREESNLAALSELLLNRYLGGMSETEREAALADLAEGLGNSPRALKESALPRRLANIVETLSGLHYQPRWEARASGPQIILGHCPFAAIIDRHPDLCRMDAYLLEKGVGAKVNQIAKLEPNERGLPVCVFGVLADSTR